MTQEDKRYLQDKLCHERDKELLLKDICARLPYGVIVETPKGKGHICDINLTIFGTEVGVNINPTIRDTFNVEDVKPYLLPLSSMTKEQKSYLYFNTKFELDRFGDLTVQIDEDDNYFYTDTSDYIFLIDWLNKNHFDYIGLIPKGLAIDATGLNCKIV